MNDRSSDDTAPSQWTLALAATGVVFGDIGTSPLYAFRESFIGHHRLPLDSFHAPAGITGGLDANTSYFLSRQTLVPTRRPVMMLWREHLFAAMMRNAESPMSFFCLPVNRVVELGSQIEI